PDVLPLSYAARKDAPNDGIAYHPQGRTHSRSPDVRHRQPRVGSRSRVGIEVDRGNKFPDRKGKYIVVEGDHYRFNIWKNDRDTTGGGDRQRTESKGMVTGGNALKLKNG